MKTAKYIASFLTALALGIVLIERFPGVLTPTDVPHEWLMFGIFEISLLDDITHGLTGILGIIALAAGYRWTIKYLMLIGGYYSLDAFFYITYGFATGQNIIDNLLLNGPHIGITILVAYALVKSVKYVELEEKTA